MDKYDIVSIGHITKDTLHYRGEVTGFTGGAAYFSSFAAKRSNAKIVVVTKLAKEDFGVLDDLRKEAIDLIAIPSRQTTSIENVFETDDLDKRKVRLISQADPFVPGDIPQVKTRIYHLGGLFLGEIPNALIEYLQPKGKIALDMQAMLRSSENVDMEFKDWAEKEQYLPMVTYLKADSLESEVTTGTSDREKAASPASRVGGQRGHDHPFVRSHCVQWKEDVPSALQSA